jgi:hypothetical protein
MSISTKRSKTSVIVDKGPNWPYVESRGIRTAGHHEM